MSSSAAAVLRAGRAPASRSAGARSGGSRATSRAAGRADPQRPSHARAVFLAAAAVALAAGLRVWSGLLFADLGYEHVRAVELGQRLEVERQALEDELAGLRGSDFLEAEAARRLGLAPPSAGQVVDLRAVASLPAEASPFVEVGGPVEASPLVEAPLPVEASVPPETSLPVQASPAAAAGLPAVASAPAPGVAP